jgi:hypothetical protein
MRMRLMSLRSSPVTRDGSDQGGRGKDQGTEINSLRTTVRRAISGPLTPVMNGLSRTLTESLPRRSGRVTDPDCADSQADSAGSIPVTRSKEVKPQVKRLFWSPGLTGPQSLVSVRAI